MEVPSYVDLSTWPAAEVGAQFVVVYSDGRTLIARDQAQSAPVRRLLREVEERMHLTLQREYVTLDEVADARRKAMAGRRGDADIGMQQAILDLIEAAHKQGASDIHVDVGEQVTSVLLRIDGTLRKTDTWPADRGLRFLGACYAMADIANKSYSPARFLAARLAPREGRDDWRFSQGLEAVRMQFNPKAFGQTYSAMRLLTTIKANLNLEDLGYEPEQLTTLLSFIRRNKGLAIIAGPTGSGKSTTLCTLLQMQQALDVAADRRRTCFTIEDPPERRLPGAQQLVIPNTDNEEQRGVAYGSAIRAALRSDPDVIMVGEIRDLISADLAISASMTGHQVWSTLHCSSAHAIPIRLADLGVDKTVIFGADELQVAVAQVLVPLLCQDCSIPLAEAEQTDEQTRLLAMLGPGARVEGPGCSHCHGAGIRGRTVLAEVVRTDTEYLSILRDQGIVAARAYSQARGEPSITDIALRKTKRGQVSAALIPVLMDVPARPSLRAV